MVSTSFKVIVALIGASFPCIGYLFHVPFAITCVAAVLFGVGATHFYINHKNAQRDNDRE